MCGPTKSMKDLNGQVQNFNQTVQSQASQVFGNDSKVFNDLMGAYNKTIAAGPDQQGFSQDEINRLNTQTIEGAASAYRNASAAAKAAGAAEGGGNVSLPSGAAGATTAAIANAAEALKAGGLQKTMLASEEQGHENYEKALAGEQAAPGVFSNVPGMDQTVSSSLKNAQESQQEMDTQGRWWQKAIMSGIGTAAGFMTGGLSAMGPGESFGEGGLDFLKGGLGLPGSPAPSS